MDDSSFVIWINLASMLVPLVILFFVFRRFRRSTGLAVATPLLSRLLPKPLAVGIIAGVSLFLGLMVAVAGGAMFPSILEPGAEMVCQGEVEVVSHHYSYKPGQSGVSRTFLCHEPDAQPREMTFAAIGISTLLFSGAIFLLLGLWGLWRHWRAPRGGDATEGTVMPAAPPHTPPSDPRAALLQSMAQMLQAQAAGKTRVMTPDEVKTFFNTSTQVHVDEGHDRSPAARMKLLDELLAQKLISKEEYDRKRAEILDAL